MPTAVDQGQALRLQLIGPLTLYREGVADPIPIPKGRATTLLALLAANHDQLVGLDEIVYALWPPSGTPNGQQIVASLVSRLRRVLGRSLERLDDGYRLTTRGWQVDLDDATRLVATAERHLAETEPGFGYAAASRALQILESGRPLEDQRSLTAADDLATTTDVLIRRARRAGWTSAMALGDAEAARRVSTAAAAAGPLDEDAVRALMQSQYELGERNAALRTYSALQRRLRDELGADPDPLTQRLHVLILRGDLSHGASRDDPAGAMPQQKSSEQVRSVTCPRLPRSPVEAHIVGRGDVLEQMLDTWHAIARGSSCPLAVIGGPDSGKSEMLRALAAHVDSSGGAVLMARCTTYERGMPLQPLADALRRYCATEHHDVIRDAARGSETALIELVPAFAEILAPSPPTLSVINPRRQLEAFHSFVMNLSSRRPVLIAIDDAHLADDETIAALHRLSAVDTRPVLVAVTSQDARAEAVSDAMGPASRRLRLRPLTAEHVEELARWWGVPHAAEEVHALTGGVPGLVSEALRAVVDGAELVHRGRPLPALSDAAASHLHAAGDSVIRLLALVAVAGRRFRLEDVLGMGYSLTEAADATQRALGLGLLVGDGDGLAFASDLVHAAALRTIPEPIRGNVERCLSSIDDRRALHTSREQRPPTTSDDLADLDPAS
ncbi:hypothetical protein GCM10009798_40480 [Nocardioides panacihumi]|uniref:OmpR/PhoB-type domain-containing protein n=1 Tax=Nocardioides panacihumi TaxID=400774 RepID=A0ABN2RUI4_9ACTN